MIRRLLLCLPLVASVAAAHGPDELELRMAESLLRAKAAAAAPRETIVAVDRCWSRLLRSDAVLDSAKLPVDFCLRTVGITLSGEGGTMAAIGEYLPAGAAKRAAIDPKPQPLSRYKSSDGTFVYAAYLYSQSNAHGDTGSIFVEFRTTADGKIVPNSIWANFGVGCPHEECEEGEEPGVRVTASDWR